MGLGWWPLNFLYLIDEQSSSTPSPLHLSAVMHRDSVLPLGCSRGSLAPSGCDLLMSTPCVLLMVRLVDVIYLYSL